MNYPTTAVTLAALALAGCAGLADLPPNYTLDPDRAEGLAVISMTLSGKSLGKISRFEYRLREIPPRNENAVEKSIRFRGTTQLARSVGRGEDARPMTGSIVVKGSDLREQIDVYESETTGGRLAAVRLPAGEYEIHTWRLDEPGPYGEVELRPRKDFSCRFNVRSGTAIYLGRLRLELGDGDTQKLVVEDRRDSDLNGFKRKYPVLANSPTAMSICNIR